MTRLSSRRHLLPAAVLVTVGVGGFLGLLSGTSGAGAAPKAGSPPASAAARTGSTAVFTPGAAHIYNTRPAITPTATACTRNAAAVGYRSPPDSGSPHNSTPTYLVCKDGKVVRYGNSAITYSLPPSSYISAGHQLFEQDCSSCHLATAQGGASAPNLRGVGPATVNFWVTTGRMPAATSFQVQADRKPPVLSVKQANEIAAWINSLTPSAPYIPNVNLKQANLADGATLFALNCAACHTITGAGDALAYNTYAPSLHAATARQVAEAIRTGPGNMPRFTGNLSDAQVRDIVAYVTEKIQHPQNAGGFGLGGIGPVAEGFVALLFGVGGLMLVAFWIGDRA